MLDTIDTALFTPPEIAPTIPAQAEDTSDVTLDQTEEKNDRMLFRPEGLIPSTRRKAEFEVGVHDQPLYDLEHE